MFTFILVIPLLAILTAYIFSTRIGSRGTWALIWSSTFFSFLCASEMLFLQISSFFTFSYVIDIVPFFYFSSYFDVSWAFKVDYLSTFIIFLITLISFFIQTFSATYIRFDVSYQRFMIFISFFSFSILLLVTASNLLVLFAGWEMVGLASFLLINFWYNRQEANWGAFKAFGFNRVGDAAFIFALVLFFFTFGTFEIDGLLILASINSNYFSVAFFFLTCAAFAKSAQFFFHSWLPDAMEGPTPVSALLHSATMVTAGVYLLLRFSDFINISPFFQFYIAFTGLLTAFYAALISTTVLDAKHSTAYTTLGQLGFMFFAVGSAAFSSAIFHLFIHGFYKSFAFLENALELFSFEDEQDGAVVNYASFKFESFNDVFGFLVFLSVNALPLASSSVSKELLVFSGFETVSNFFTFFFFSIIFIGFIDSTWDDNYADYNTSSFFYFDSAIILAAPFTIYFSYFFLGICTIFIVFFTEDLFIGLSFFWSDFYTTWLFLDGSFFLILPFISTLAVFFFYPTNAFYTLDNYVFIEFLDQLFYYERFVTNFLNISFSFFFWFFAFQVDKGFINYFFVNSFSYLRTIRTKIPDLFFSNNFFIATAFGLFLYIFFLELLNNFFLISYMRFFSIYKYIQTLYDNLAQIFPPKYVFFRPLPPIFFVSTFNKFFSIATFYSYSFFASRPHHLLDPNHFLIAEYKNFLSNFSDSSNHFEYDTVVHHFQSLINKNSLFIASQSFKKTRPNSAFFSGFVFPIYYGKVIYASFFIKDKAFQAFNNYARRYFLPFYFSPFYTIFLGLANSFFEKQRSRFFNSFFLFVFFIFQIIFIFFSPFFLLIFFIIKLIPFFINVFLKFFFNPFRFVLHNFFIKFNSLFVGSQWLNEKFVTDFLDSEHDVANVSNFKKFTPSQNDDFSTPINSTENVKYKKKSNPKDDDPKKHNAFFIQTFLHQINFFFYSSIAKLARNYDFKPFFFMKYTDVASFFRRFNKRIRIFFYETYALSDLRRQFFPLTQPKTFGQQYWFFNFFSTWASVRTYPFARFNYFFEFLNAQFSYYFYRILLNLQQFNNFASRLVLFKFFRIYGRRYVLLYLRTLVFSFFLPFKFENFVVKLRSNFILSFEKPYFYAPAYEFYTTFFYFKKFSFSISFSVFNQPSQFYQKLFLSRLTSRRISNLSFSTYLLENNLTAKKFSFDPLFQIFTNYHTFNMFFPIFSYIGFDYLYDKNVFRDRYLTDSPSYEDKTFNLSSSSEFYDLTSEMLNAFSQTSNRTDRTVFHDFITVDSFQYYEDFSHLTYFFGYYTDFFFKFIFWPKVITKKLYLSDTYFYFYTYFTKNLRKNLIPIFFFYVFYLDVILKAVYFFQGFFSYFFFQSNYTKRHLTSSYRLFLIFFFNPIKLNFFNFYNSFFYYSNSSALLGEHFELTDEERSNDLGHNSEDFSTLADVDRFQFEEDIATDYVNHLLEEHYYSTYLDDEDFRFPDFDAFDAYVFEEELYEPSYMDDELQIALDFAYEAEFGTFFNIFEEAQYQDLDESVYEKIMNFFESIFFLTQDKMDFATFYIDDDMSVEERDDSIEDIFDTNLAHETDDTSSSFTSKKSLTVFKNYTTAYEDYLAKWLVLNKSSQIFKYKKLPPFLYGIGRYGPKFIISNTYRKIMYSEKAIPFTFNDLFYQHIKSSLLIEAVFKQLLDKPDFITKRFSNDTKMKNFFLLITNVFNLPIFLFPKDPYLTNFILTQQLGKYFDLATLNLANFSINIPIKHNSFRFKFFDLIESFYSVSEPVNKPSRLSEYYFESNQVPIYSYLTLFFNSFSYFVQRYIIRDKTARMVGGNVFDHENLVLQNTKGAENILPTTDKLPRIDEWYIYQSPSIMDLPHTYLVEPTDRLWYSIYFNNQIRGYKTVNDHYFNFLKPPKVDVFRPLVYIRSLRKFIHEDEVYSYAKRLRRRLYEIRHTHKYPFIKDGYRIEELLDPKLPSPKKFKFSNLFFFSRFQNVNDWSFHPEFKAYQSLAHYLSPDFSELIFPNFSSFFSYRRPLSRVLKRRFFFTNKVFNFTTYRPKNFFRRKVKKLKLFATLLFASLSPFSSFESANAPYKFGSNFERFYYVRDPALKDPTKFVDFEDMEESPFAFFVFFNSFFSSFQYYRIFDTFLFPYQYTFPFGNFYYDHDIFDLDEDENQEFSSFDLYVLEEPDPDSTAESFEAVETEPGSYSDLVDFSFDDEFDDTSAFYDLEKDIDNSTSSADQSVLGTTFYDNPIPETGSEKADVAQSALPFDPDVYDELYVLNDFVEFDEGYHNVLRLEYYEIALLEELICQLYEKYINVLETYPVDFFPPKMFNWSSLSYKSFEITPNRIFRTPKNINDLFNEIRPYGKKYKEVDKKYFWMNENDSTVKIAHLKSKINRFNRKSDRRILAVIKILQFKYAKQYPKTLDPYYFRRFELFLDDFFNLPEFGTGRYFNIFKIHSFSNEISEAEIFDWFEDNNLEYHNMTLTDFFEDIDFENDTLDPDAFEFWAETTTPIARFFFGYARSPSSAALAADNRFFFNEKLNLSDQNYITPNFPFSNSTTSLTFAHNIAANRFFSNPLYSIFAKTIRYFFFFIKSFFVWFYYYYFLLRPEIQFQNSFKTFYTNHFFNYDRYYSHQYFKQLYDFLLKWDSNFKLDPHMYTLLEHEYGASLQNPISYSTFSSNLQNGASSPYLFRLFSYFNEPEFEYYIEEFFLDNEQLSNVRIRTYNKHSFADYQSKSQYANILNTFFFWNYDELFYEELGKFFDDVSYDENLSYTHSPMYTSEFLPESSLDESIDFAPFIEELYAIDHLEFDSKFTIFIEFLDDLVRTYSIMFFEYLNSMLILSFALFSSIYTLYEKMWLKLFILYGPVTFFFRGLFSFSFFLILLFYALFIIPYLVFFYLPLRNYFFSFLLISAGLFAVFSCLFYLFSKIFRNFYKTMSIFEFEVFFLTLSFCWFEHVYWGNHIYPVNTVEIFDNPLIGSPNAESDISDPYQTLHYLRLGEKSYNSYFMSPYHIHLNVRQYRQVLRSFIFSYRVNLPEFYNELINESEPNDSHSDMYYKRPTQINKNIVFYPDYDDLFTHSDLPINNFFEWTQIDDGFYFDFLNRGMFYIFTFEDFKKIFWEFFLPLTKPYYVHQSLHRVYNDDKKWVAIIRRYHNLFTLSFENNSNRQKYKRSRRHPGRIVQLPKLPSRLQTPFHYFPQAKKPSLYDEARLTILRTIGARAKLLGPNMFPHQIELRSLYTDNPGSILIRRFNRYSPFYNLSSFDGEEAGYLHARDIYSPFVYTMSKFLDPLDFSLKAGIARIVENKYSRFPFQFFKNSSNIVNYNRGRGGLFDRHIEYRQNTQAFATNIFNHFKTRQKDVSAQLATNPVYPKTFSEAVKVYENSINLAADQHVKKSIIVKSYYYRLYRSGFYDHSTTNKAHINPYFSSHFKFSSNFTTLYYWYSKRPFQVFYASRSFLYRNSHTFDNQFYSNSAKKLYKVLKHGYYSYIPARYVFDPTDNPYPSTFNTLLNSLLNDTRPASFSNEIIISSNLYPKKTAFYNINRRKFLSVIRDRQIRVSEAFKNEQTADILKFQRYNSDALPTFKTYYLNFINYLPVLILGDRHRRTIANFENEKIISFPDDHTELYLESAALKLLKIFPTLLEPIHFDKLIGDTLTNATFFQSFLLALSAQRNTNITQAYKFRQQEKIRLDFNRFVFNKKDFFSRFSFYDVSPIYTANSPLSKLLINDFFGFNFSSPLTHFNTPPITDPFFYYHSASQRKHIRHKNRHIPVQFNDLYNSKVQFPFFQLNNFEIKRDVNIWPNTRKQRFFKEADDLWPSIFKYFKEEEKRYVSRAFNLYGSPITSSSFFIRGPRILRYQIFIPLTIRKIFGIFPIGQQVRTKADFRKYHKQWSVNINSKLMQDYFTQESVKFEFFTHNMRYDSPYSRLLKQVQPPNYIRHTFTNQIRAIYTYPFYSTITPYRDPFQFALRRPEEPLREREEVLDDDDYQSEIQTIQLNLFDAIALMGSSTKRRWETTFHRIHHATAFRAFFEYPNRSSFNKSKNSSPNQFKKFPKSHVKRK